jgi:hypothetical protein
MKKIVLLLLLIKSVFGFSQNLENLDDKYGFNKFKLGSSYQSYSKDLEFQFSDDETGAKAYKYTKKDISIFGFSKVNEINLVFYRDKLYTININLIPSYSDDMFSTILSKLKDLFGYPTAVSSGGDYGKLSSKTYMENVNQWESSKTLLGLSKTKCSSPLNPCGVNLFLVSQIIHRQINNDGF